MGRSLFGFAFPSEPRLMHPGSTSDILLPLLASSDLTLQTTFLLGRDYCLRRAVHFRLHGQILPGFAIRYCRPNKVVAVSTVDPLSESDFV
jgi:hypothetical protein